LDILAAIDTRIAELQRLREQVVELMGGELPPGKAEPRSAPAAPGQTSRCGANAERLLRALAAGPLRAKELKDRAGVPKGSITAALECPWFQKAGTKKYDPWELTEAGDAG